MTRRKEFWHNRIHLILAVIGCLMICKNMNGLVGMTVMFCGIWLIGTGFSWSYAYAWEPVFRNRYSSTAKHIIAVKDLVLQNRNLVHEINRQIRLSGKKAKTVLCDPDVYKTYIKLAEVYGFWLTIEKIDQLESETKILCYRHSVRNQEDTRLLDYIDDQVLLHNIQHTENEGKLLDILKYIREEEGEELYA